MRTFHIHILDECPNEPGTQVYGAILDSSIMDCKSMRLQNNINRSLVQGVLQFLLTFIQKYEPVRCRLKVYCGDPVFMNDYPSGKILEELYGNTPTLKHRDAWQQLVDEVVERGLQLQFDSPRVL